MLLHSVKLVLGSAFLLLHTAIADLIPFDSWAHQRVVTKDVNIHFRYAGTGPPLILQHGLPQYSLTYHTIGPILAQHFTVITPDLRGVGESSIPTSYNFSAPAAAEDLKAILDFLNITQSYIFAHDKGCGPTAALAINYPSLIKRIGFAEYVLPGYGYETVSDPAPTWDLNSNFQLALFAEPDAAQYLLQNNLEAFLGWYFYHISYSGNQAIPNDHLKRYVREIEKFGYLRSGLEWFGAATIGIDHEFFTAALSKTPIMMPMLVLGGEASFAPASVLAQFWSPIGANISYDIVPKAGHWIGDENPEWVAQRLLEFYAEPAGESLPSVNLSYLTNKVTMV